MLSIFCAQATYLLGPQAKEEQVSEARGGVGRETHGRIRDDRILSTYYSASLMNLPSARMHKTECSSREGDEARGNNNMACHEPCCGERGGPCEPPAGPLYQPRLPGAEKAEGMKKCKTPFFFKLAKKNSSQSADRKNCSSFQKVWVKCFCFFCFILFPKVK